MNQIPIGIPIGIPMDIQSTVANIDSHTLTAQIDPRIHRRCLDQIMMFLVKEKEEAVDHLHVPPMRIKVLPNQCHRSIHYKYYVDIEHASIDSRA